MSKWEYQFITSRRFVDTTSQGAVPEYRLASRNGEALSAVLVLHRFANELGNDGWELVSDTILQDTTRETVFKRLRQ